MTLFAVDTNKISCSVVNTTIEEGSTEGQNEGIEGSEDENGGSESREVCGTDNQTYKSLCHLLQTSVNVHILHAGACNTGECRAMKVQQFSIFCYTIVNFGNTCHCTVIIVILLSSSRCVAVTASHTIACAS